MFWPKGPSSYPPPNHNALALQDYIPFIRRSILASWHSRWDQCVGDGNKVVQLKPSLGPGSSCSHQCRRLEVSLSRCHIGHIRLTHGHLMAREATPVCGICQVSLLIFHVLAKGPTYSMLHHQFSLP